MQRRIFSYFLALAAVLAFAGAAQAQQKFTAGLNTIQEVPPSTNSLGRGSCVITLNTAETQITVSCEYSRLSSNLTAGHIHGNAAPGANAGVLFNFNPPTGNTAGTFNAGPFNVTAQQVRDMRAHLWYVNLHTTNFPGGEIRGQIKISTQPADYDGDGRSDIRVFRGGAAPAFYTLSSVNGSIFTNFYPAGATNTLLNSTADDFDGDGRADLFSLTPNAGVRTWRILQSLTNTLREVSFGDTSAAVADQIIPADYDGDGKVDIGVFRRSTGVWYYIQSSTNTLVAQVWGSVGDFGHVGDFDKDGRNDLTTIRGTANGVTWFTRRSSDNALQITYWGGATMPAGDFIFPSVQIDVDGDGAQDKLIVRDPDTSVTGNQFTYYILRSSDNGQVIFPFGLDTDGLLWGDYDGDGRTDHVARRNIGGTLTWFILQSSNNQYRVVPFGMTGDVIPPPTEGNLESEQIVLPKIN